MPTIMLNGQKIRLPDNLTPDQIDQAVSEIDQMQKNDPSYGMSAAEAFIVSTGRGMARFGRGAKTLFNMVTNDKEAVQKLLQEGADEAQLFKSLDERFPVATTLGGIAGEIAAGAPLGFGAGSLAMKGTTALATRGAAGAATARFAPAIAAGTAEGAVIGAAEGQPLTGAALGAGFGAVGEAVLPLLGKLKNALVPNMNVNITTPSGQVSPELEQVFREANIDLNKVLQSGRGFTAEELASMEPNQLVRRMQFDELGITPAGRSRITRQSEDFARETQLARDTINPEARAIQQAQYEETKGFHDLFERLSRQIGNPEDLDDVKQAFVDIYERRFVEPRREAYKKIGQMVRETGNADLITMSPLSRDRILTVVDQNLENFQALAGDVQPKLDKILAKFGIIGDEVEEIGRKSEIKIAGPGEREQVLTIAGKVTPLAVDNADAFRQQVRNAFDMTKPNEKALATALIRSIDDTVDEAVEAMSVETDIPGAIMKQIQKARGLYRAERQAFGQKDLAEKLIAFKTGTENPVIAASEAFDAIKPKIGAEQLKKVWSIYGKTDDGKRAIANMQAATVARILSDAIGEQALTSTINGETVRRLIPSKLDAAFKRHLGGLDSQYAKTFFGDRPDVLETLKKAAGTLRLTQTPDNAQIRGSYDLVNKLLGMMGRGGAAGQALRDSAGSVIAGRQARREVKQQLNLRPDQAQMKEFLQFSMPRFAATLYGAPAATSTTVEREY